MKPANHYIDNTKFFTEIVKYQTRCKDHVDAKKEIPKVPNYIADCFLRIADNLGNLKKFRNYPFLEEMKSDAVYYCLKYMHNFSPEKTQNPFSYFTKISYYAFLQRIQSEKKFLYKKYKAIQNTELFLSVSDRQAHDKGDYSNDIQYDEHSRENMNDFIVKYETSLKRKKR